MKTLLLILATVTCAHAGWVQSSLLCTGGFSVTSATCSLASLPAPGSLVTVAQSLQNNSGPATLSMGAPTDNQGNTYTLLKTSSGSAAITALYGTIAGTSTGTFTVTASSSFFSLSADISLIVSEYSGTTLTVDASASLNDGCTGGGPCQLGTITTTNANDVLIAVCGADPANGNVYQAASVGWNQRVPPNSGTAGNWYTVQVDQQVSATNTFTPTLGCTPTYNCASTIGACGSVVVALKQAPPSMTASPLVIPSTHPGHITLTLAGAATAWNSGTTVFTVSGVAGVTKISQTVTSVGTGTIVISTGSGVGLLTVSDGTLSTSVTVGAPSLFLSPSSSTVGAVVAVTLTGTNTVWTQENAATLISLSGGLGTVWQSGYTVVSDTSITGTLVIGGLAGGTVITDNSIVNVCTITPSSLGPYTNTQVLSGITFTSSGGGCTGTWNCAGLASSGLSCSGGSGSTTTLSGTASNAATPYSVVVTQGAGSDSFSLVVNAVPSSGTCGGTGPPACPAATIGTAYSQTIATSGGTSPVTCPITTGSLPAGITQTGCLLSGTPSGSAGTSNFTVTPTDANSVTGTPVAYSMVAGSGCAVTPSSLGPYTNGQVVSGVTFTATGAGCGSLTWTIGGNGSSGLGISGGTGSTTTLSGTASNAASPYSIIVSKGTNTDPFTLVVNAAPSITACGSGTVSSGAATCDSGTAGTAYSKNVTSSGGTPTVTYGITSGGSTLTALSLSMASNGTIGGTPTAGTATFTVVATDANSVASSGVVMTLVVASGGGGGLTYLNGTGAQSTDGGVTATTGTALDCHLANLIVLVAVDGASATHPVPSDSSGNTYVQDAAETFTGNSQVYVFHVYAPTVTSSMTFGFTDSGGTFSPSVAAACFSGAASSPFDASAINTGGGNTVNTGNITTTVNNELWVSGLTLADFPTSAPTPTNGTLIFSAELGSNSYGIGMSYAIVASSGSIATETWNWSGSSINAVLIGSWK